MYVGRVHVPNTVAYRPGIPTLYHISEAFVIVMLILRAYNIIKSYFYVSTSDIFV